MVTIEVIDDTAISWPVGNDFDLRFQAMIGTAIASGAVDVMDESAISWETGSAIDVLFEAAVAAALESARAAAKRADAITSPR